MFKIIPYTPPKRPPLQYGPCEAAAAEAALRNVTEEIKSAQTFYDLEVACGKASQLEIHSVRRESLIAPVRESYRLITGEVLSKLHARALVKYSPWRELWWE